MLEISTTVGIPNGCATGKEITPSSRPSSHPEKSRRRKSKDGGSRMSGLWCASGQRSPTSSFDVTSPYDIPHLSRALPAAAAAASGTPPPPPPTSAVFNGSTSTTTSEDSGVHCGGRSPDEFVETAPRPRDLPPSGPARPSSASAVKLSQRGNPSRDACDRPTRRGSNPVATATTTAAAKSTMFRSLSSFSLKTFSIRRSKDAASKRPQQGGSGAVASPLTETASMTPGARMEQSRKRVGGSLPGEDRLDLSSETAAGADDEVQRKRTHTQVVAQRLSRLGRSFRRRQSADRAASEAKNPPDPASESSSTASSTSSTTSTVNQALVLYGTASRARRSSFKISISVPSFDANGNASGGAERSGVRKSGCEFAPTLPPPPHHPGLPDGVRLVKILKLEQYVTNKWISGMTISDKNELVIVDLRCAYLVDEWGNLIRTIGAKGSDRLIEPIGVSAGPEGRLVFSDHAQQNVKVYTSRGNHLRTITDFCLANIAGVACNRSTGEIFVAGTDRKKVFVHADGQTRTVPSDAKSTPNEAAFKHPFSVAYNAVNGQIIVGDDYDQSVMAVTGEGRLAWRFCPPTQEGERQFFPSSVCVDHDGTVFVADLYNGKVCVLDSEGRFVRTLLSRDFGLTGNPGAIATDGRGHIFVADEERTVKVFQYKKIV